MDIKYNYILTDLAHTHLQAIAEYYEKLALKQYGEQLNRQFEQKILTACKQPHLYQLDTSPFLSLKGVRKIPVKEYVVYYIANEAESRIEVIAILHEKQNARKLKLKTKKTEQKSRLF